MHTVEEKYCPQCGSTLHEVSWEDGLNILQCAECGYKLYKNSKPCVIAIIVDDDRKRILLSRRGIEPYKGYWDLPGGFLRNGEDPLKGVKREVREELGVECEPVRFFDIFVDTYGEFDVYTFNVCYIVKLLSDDIRPADDIDEAQWFGFDDLPENLAFRFLGDIIEKVKNEIAF